MKLWITRHGQTDYNKMNKIQGLVDAPLNETGIMQAKKARALIGGIRFDRVYSSPLIRALDTASIIGEVDKDKIITDKRILETDFGKYELCDCTKMGIAMTLYWSFPEIFPAPESVETVASMIKRTSDFLKELEQKDLENVLIVCHGGIIRPICGYLEDRKSGIKWRPRPKNCEVRVYESKGGMHRFIESYAGS